MNLPSSYKCPHCGVVTASVFHKVLELEHPIPRRYQIRNPYNQTDNFVYPEDVANFYPLESFAVGICQGCRKPSFWFDGKLVWPFSSRIKPHEDMPETAKKYFIEAQSILHLSPRSSCALLRCCLEELVKEAAIMMNLIESEKFKKLNNLRDKITALGLDTFTNTYLQSCRIIGNDAAHPGVLDFSGKDSVKIAVLLSEVINNASGFWFRSKRLNSLASQIEAERKTRREHK